VLLHGEKRNAILDLPGTPPFRHRQLRSREPRFDENMNTLKLLSLFFLV
jgi:hypothetical protein